MKKNSSERGSALMLVTIITLILFGISFAFMSVSWWNGKRAANDEAAAQALMIAESGAAQYINGLNAGGLLQKVDKQYLAGGYFWVPQENIVDFGNPAVGANNLDADFASIQVAGRFNNITRRIDVLLTHKSGGVFWNAIFAGNIPPGTPLPAKPDPNSKYGLNLGATDTVRGDIYSGGGFNAAAGATITDPSGGTGSKVTSDQAANSTVAGPTYVTGDEPSLEIKRNFGSGADMLEAEFMATQNAATKNGGRDGNNIAWVDVAGQFNSSTLTSTNYTGASSNDIMDPNNPAHIFRKDPSSTSGAGNNRTTTYEYTAPSAKHDYYLEDPTNGGNYNYQATGLGGNTVNGDTNSSKININETGNNAVYFIDGNMRISGEPIKSYQLEGNPANTDPNVKVTFIVKGNVSLTDNLLYPKWQSATDAAAIIAVTDPNYPNTTPEMFATNTTTGMTTYGPSNNKVSGPTGQQFVDAYNQRASRARSNGLNMPDISLGTAAGQAKASQEYNKIYGSGNVFFGDPGSGTVEHFEAYMFAENNFYATNLDTSTGSGGTKQLEIYGNMTAGNQVNIDRSSSQSTTGTIPLKVTLDTSIMLGTSKPPGLPPTPTVNGEDWHIMSWKQSANTAEVNPTADKR